MFYAGKSKKSKFKRLQIEVFFLLNIRSPTPLYTGPSKYRPIKFVFCPYICSGHINGILQYCMTFLHNCWYQFGFLRWGINLCFVRSQLVYLSVQDWHHLTYLKQLLQIMHQLGRTAADSIFYLAYSLFIYFI